MADFPPDDVRKFIENYYGGVPTGERVKYLPGTGAGQIQGFSYPAPKPTCGSKHPKHGVLCGLPKAHAGPLHMQHFDGNEHNPEQVYCWLVKDHSLDPVPPEPEPPLIVIDLEDYGL